jgi:hypothetical protein
MVGIGKNGGLGRDCSRHADFAQARLTTVFHPTTEPHAGLVGPGGMLGLNVEFDPGWLDRHDLAEGDLGGYRPVEEVRSRLAVLQLLTTGFDSGPQADADADTTALELKTNPAH